MELYGDENLTNAAEQHRIQIPKGCRWSDMLSTTDPTCGTGEMLLNPVMDLRKDDREWLPVKLYA